MSLTEMEKNKVKTQYKNKDNKFPVLKADIFQSATDRINAARLGAHVVIPHVCNNIDVFGGGFTRDLSAKYPIVQKNYHLLGTSVRLGKVQYIEVDKNPTYNHKLIIANMIAQNGTISPKNPRPLNYGALAFCMTDVRQYCNSLKDNIEYGKVEIHAPKFGSGLAGGDWFFIQELMLDIWKNLDTFIYIK